MDDYPEHLAPPRDAFGSIDTERFGEWWAEASKFYSNVPEEAARYWIFEHWGVSPYRSLKSSEYRFERKTLPAQRLLEVRSTWCRFDPEQKECREKGAELCHRKMLNGGRYPTADYMMEEGQFPTPIVVLDNSDGHMSEEQVGLYDGLPISLVLMEGHTRFNIALYLLSVGRLSPTVDVWLINKTTR